MRILTPSAALLTLVLAAGTVTAQTAPMAGSAAAPVALPAVTLAPGESPEMMFTDAKIAAVASASNLSEIDPSQLALNQGQSQAVKDYARQMVDDHTRFERQMREALARKKMAVQDNALSFQMKRNGPPTLEMLRTRTGAEFDRAYMVNQIASHQMTLETLDTSLIPLAKDPELKGMLRDTVRPAVAQHLQRAMQILGQMSTAMR